MSLRGSRRLGRRANPISNFLTLAGWSAFFYPDFMVELRELTELITRDFIITGDVHNHLVDLKNTYQPRITEAIDDSLAITEKAGLTPDARLALIYSLAVQRVLEPIIQKNNPQEIADLCTEIPGHVGSTAARKVDLIGEIIYAILEEHGFSPKTDTAVHLEESGWNRKNIDEAGNIIFIDPFDGTGNFAGGRGDYMSVGFVELDRNGSVVTVSIASLTTGDLYFFDGKNNYTYFPKEGHTLISSMDQLQKFTPTPRDKRNPIRKGTLERRISDLTRFFPNETWSCTSEGGKAVLDLLAGKYDVLFDPVKGQPLYEFLIWITAARQAGIVVAYPNGIPMTQNDWQELVKKSRLDVTCRQPFIVGRDRDVVRTISQKLLHEKAIFYT